MVRRRSRAVVRGLSRAPGAHDRSGLNDTGAEVVTSGSPQEFAGFMQAQTAHWQRLVKDIGVVAD